MNRKPSAERLLSFLFLLITLGVVLYIGFSGNDLEALGEALRTMSPAYLFLCLLSWILYVLTDALAIHHFLRMQGCPIRLWQSLRAAMTGIYYSNVTPGATGGQPMEMYCLHKYGVSIGVSGSGMAVKFIVFQVVLLDDFYRFFKTRTVQSTGEILAQNIDNADLDALAERLQVSRQAVSRWERDETMPETDKVVALADIFGVTTDYLLRPQPKQTETAAEEPPRQQRDWVERFLDFAKRKWYLLGWVLIAWGVLDLVQLAIFYLAYRGLLGGFTGLLGW